MRALSRPITVLATITLLAAPATASAGHHPRHHRHHHHHRRARQQAVQPKPPAPAPASSPPPVCSGTGDDASATNLGAMRSAVVCLINQQRRAHGLPALREDARLDASAQAWTVTMVANQSFTHGPDFASRISAAGLVWQDAGENIATGYPTPATVVAAWMASTDHCQNILDPDYSDVGTGVVAAPVSGYGSGGATWTQDFALPMGQSAPSRNWAPAHGCPY